MSNAWPDPLLLMAAVTAAVVLMMLVAVSVGALLRARRHRAAARRERLATTIRPLISDAMDIADGAGSVAMDHALRALSRSAGETLDDLVVALVPKLRGTERKLLVELLRRRGTIERVARDLTSRSPRRRLSAVEFLGAVDDGSHAAALVRLLDDRDEAVRLAAIRALGRIGLPEAVPALLGRLDRPEPRRELPRHAVTMAVLRCGSGSADHVLQSLRHGGAASRLAAAQVLGWLGELGAAPELRDALAHDTSPDVRAAAAEALGRLGVPETAADLVVCLDEPHPALVRVAAATALGLIGDTASATGLAMTLCTDADLRVRLAAAQAMARLGGPGLSALRVLSPVSPHAREVLRVTLAGTPEPPFGALLRTPL